MLIRMIKFGLIIICLCSIYTPPLINQQDTSIEIKSSSKTLDSPFLQKDQKTDLKVNYWRKTWTQKLENSNLASRFQNALKHSSFDSRLNKIQNIEIFLSTRTRQRIRRYTQNDHSTMPSRRNINIFIPNNGDRFDTWGG